MEKKVHSEKGLRRLLKIILLFIHFGIFFLLCVSGYSSNYHPANHPWLVSSGLAFGPILVVYCSCCLLWLVIDFRWFVNSLIGLLICSIPVRTYCPINFSRLSEEGSSVKVLSYNVNSFSRENKEKQAEIYNFILRTQADMICLQEANYLPSEKKNHDSMMSYWKYRDTTMFQFNTLSLYTRYPIIDKCIVSSPDVSHGAVIYRVNMDGDTIVVVNSHFCSNAISDSDKTIFKEVVKEPGRVETKSNIHYLVRKVDEAGIYRAQQVDNLMKYLKLLKLYPIVLCGDFNDSPISYVHSQLTSVLNDSYTRGGNGPGISYHEAGMFFRIDHILCSSHWSVLKSKVYSNAKSSDHYPICSWLRLN